MNKNIKLQSAFILKHRKHLLFSHIRTLLPKPGAFPYSPCHIHKDHRLSHLCVRTSKCFLGAQHCESVSVSHSIMSDSATPWTVACRAPLSMGFSRQEYWSGLPFPSVGSSWPRDRTQVSCTAGRFFTIYATREPGRKTSKSTGDCWGSSPHLVGSGAVSGSQVNHCKFLQA